MTDEPTTVEPGQRWRFTHHGFPFDIRVTELTLDGDVVHGVLIAGPPGVPGNAGDVVVVPTTSVLSGERVP